MVYHSFPRKKPTTFNKVEVLLPWLACSTEMHCTTVEPVVDSTKPVADNTNRCFTRETSVPFIKCNQYIMQCWHHELKMSQSISSTFVINFIHNHVHKPHTVHIVARQ